MKKRYLILGCGLLCSSISAFADDPAFAWRWSRTHWEGVKQDWSQQQLGGAEICLVHGKFVISLYQEALGGGGDSDPWKGSNGKWYRDVRRHHGFDKTYEIIGPFKPDAIVKAIIQREGTDEPGLYLYGVYSLVQPKEGQFESFTLYWPGHDALILRHNLTLDSQHHVKHDTSLRAASGSAEECPAPFSTTPEVSPP